jgi:hypothetical protein
MIFIPLGTLSFLPRCLCGGRHRIPAVPIKVMRCNARLALIFFDRLKMTGEQSRHLKVDDRVRWDKSLTDRGTISEADWRGVTVKWDDGRANTIYHNDMAQVDRVPVNLG